MGYLALARKYRPQTFASVVGQEHITTTLTNALTSGRIAHAYLFAGSRGVGKTTTARILAKALNCQKRRGIEPCNTCASCTEIQRGVSLDILEIDGASNRGIDEIRDLRENVKFAASHGGYRVYIIDEVHMLTAEAFNALLKTLEEPPAHVVFIFATTQPHKMPPTILSRCQRFDFHRLKTAQILEHLTAIAREEKVKVDPAALALIAKYAEGSMRDGEVILDQLISAANGKITADGVTKTLGLIGDDLLFAMSSAIRARDAGAALATVDRLVNEGKDIALAVAALIEHFRNLSVVKLCASPAGLIDADGEVIQRYVAEAGSFTIDEILYCIYTLSGALDLVKKTALGRIPLEAALVKLTRMTPTVSLAALIERLERLERTAPAVSASATSSAPVTTPARPVEAPPATSVAPAPETRRTDPAPVPQSAPRPAHGPIDLDTITNAWEAITRQVITRKMPVGLFLQEGYPIRIEGTVLSIGFPKSSSFHKEALESAESKTLIEEVIKEMVQREFKIKLVISDYVTGKNGSVHAAPHAGDGDDTTIGGADVDPLVKDALKIFDASIRREAQRGK